MILTRLRFIAILGLLVGVGLATTVYAQLDPIRRDLIELGYDRPIEGHAPLAAYAFYYLNRPRFYDPDRTLRIAVSPVYLDGELGMRRVLGPTTDLGIGFDGGGFAYDYDEIRRGHWFRDQSFTGNGAGASLSVYHLFNPEARIPLNGELRGSFRYVIYERDNHNPEDFVLPKDQPMASVRAGLRLGGVPPVLRPDIAGELSAWYEGQFRFEPGDYGFSGDRRVESNVHLFWGRAFLAYTLPGLGHRLSVEMVAGGTVHPDRLSAYRLGGSFTLASEFPLLLPGYYSGELSARNFVLVGGAYGVPIDSAQHWLLSAGASSARIAYTPGLEQPRSVNSGASLELKYQSESKAWKTSLVYGYGFDAIRGTHRGGSSVAVLMQFDLGKMGYMKSEPESLPVRPAPVEQM